MEKNFLSRVRIPSHPDTETAPPPDTCIKSHTFLPMPIKNDKNTIGLARERGKHRNHLYKETELRIPKNHNYKEKSTLCVLEDSTVKSTIEDSSE